MLTMVTGSEIALNFLVGVTWEQKTKENAELKLESVLNAIDISI